MYTIRRVFFLSITTRLYRYIYNFSLLLGVLQLHAVVNELYSFALVFVKYEDAYCYQEGDHLYRC